eukprot:jgi/Bigna1/70580/fgenesh1_pg.12_\
MLRPGAPVARRASLWRRTRSVTFRIHHRRRVLPPLGESIRRRSFSKLSGPETPSSSLEPAFHDAKEWGRSDLANRDVAAMLHNIIRNSVAWNDHREAERLVTEGLSADVGSTKARVENSGQILKRIAEELYLACEEAVKHMAAIHGPSASAAMQLLDVLCAAPTQDLLYGYIGRTKATQEIQTTWQEERGEAEVLAVLSTVRSQITELVLKTYLSRMNSIVETPSSPSSSSSSSSPSPPRTSQHLLEDARQIIRYVHTEAVVVTAAALAESSEEMGESVGDLQPRRRGLRRQGGLLLSISAYHMLIKGWVTYMGGKGEQDDEASGSIHNVRDPKNIEGPFGSYLSPRSMQQRRPASQRARGNDEVLMGIYRRMVAQHGIQHHFSTLVHVVEECAKKTKNIKEALQIYQSLDGESLVDELSSIERGGGQVTMFEDIARILIALSTIFGAHRQARLVESVIALYCRIVKTLGRTQSPHLRHASEPAPDESGSSSGSNNSGGKKHRLKPHITQAIHTLTRCRTKFLLTSSAALANIASGHREGDGGREEAARLVLACGPKVLLELKRVLFGSVAKDFRHFRLHLTASAEGTFAQICQNLMKAADQAAVRAWVFIPYNFAFESGIRIRDKSAHFCALRLASMAPAAVAKASGDAQGELSGINADCDIFRCMDIMATTRQAPLTTEAFLLAMRKCHADGQLRRACRVFGVYLLQREQSLSTEETHRTAASTGGQVEAARTGVDDGRPPLKIDATAAGPSETKYGEGAAIRSTTEAPAKKAMPPDVEWPLITE